MLYFATLQEYMVQNILMLKLHVILQYLNAFYNTTASDLFIIFYNIYQTLITFILLEDKAVTCCSVLFVHTMV